MQTVLHELVALLIASVPTIVIFLLLHFYLRGILYRPLGKLLAERHARTDGQFDIARRTIALAGQKLTEYEAILREARAAMYRDIEDRRVRALAERAELLAAARARAEAARRAAELELEREMAQARSQLEAGAESLATDIYQAVLGRRPMVNPGVGA
ncbi:MAG: hypothetical protein ACRD2E_06145 [Terriglobales bacterium]